MGLLSNVDLFVLIGYERRVLSIEVVFTFLIASALLALAPGPDNLFVLTQSATRGRLAGISVTLGLCTGLVAHSLAVAFGAAALFKTSAFAFTLMKLVGAGYLVYLAWGLFRARTEIAEGSEGARLSLKSLYARGIVMNITNPKVSIFFLSFLPQFASPERGHLTGQLLALGGWFIVSTLLIFSGIAILADTLGRWVLRDPHVRGVMNKVAGTLFLGLAIKLALAER